MAEFQRYAIYFAPQIDSALERFGAAWLGWDARAGAPCAHPEVSGLPLPVAELTATPRKYGFHGTLKPPFALAEGQSYDDLLAGARAFAAEVPAFALDGLEVARLGGFVALTSVGDTGPLTRLACGVVEALEPFRAPLTEAAMAKRRAGGLSPRQEALMQRFGYPYVFEQFRFHLTLTGRLEEGMAETVRARLATHLGPMLADPVPVGDLAVFGEAEDGRFHELTRVPLG